MEALANLSSRGDAMVVTNLCEMLEDADTAVRNLGVRLLPVVTQEHEDNHALDQVLLRLYACMCVRERGGGLIQPLTRCCYASTTRGASTSTRTGSQRSVTCD